MTMPDIGNLTLPELVALMHQVADEIELRMMQTADDGK